VSPVTVTNLLRARPSSLSTLVLVLILTTVLQFGISYTLAFGRLGAGVPPESHGLVASIWLGLRLFLVVLTVVLWVLDRKRSAFRAIIATNSALTLGLLFSVSSLVDVLTGLPAQGAKTLLNDVVLLAASNVLIFSVWYWIIDPPGVVEGPVDESPWDFLFPQRGATLPGYEEWVPAYTDYLYVAFTASFAFSPTDTLPLSRRAKLLMLVQSAISIVTLTVIAGSAINILAGGGG
jgi:hypothetical protein